MSDNDLRNMLNITKIFEHGARKPKDCLRDKKVAQTILSICESLYIKKFANENLTWSNLSDEFPDLIQINLDPNSERGIYVIIKIANVAIKWLLNNSKKKIDLREKSNVEKKIEHPHIGFIKNSQFTIELNVYGEFENCYFKAGEVAFFLWAPNFSKGKAYPRMEKLINALSSSTLSDSGQLYINLKADDFISESELYTAILNSGSPRAIPMKRKLAEEILPELRKKGYYAERDTIEITNKPAINEYLNAKKSDLFKLAYEQQLKIEEQDDEIYELKPLAEFTREILNTPGGYTSEEMAKELGLRSAHELFVRLQARGYIYRKGDKWFLFADFIGLGLLQNETELKNENVGRIIKWSENGRYWLHSLELGDNKSYQKCINYIPKKTQIPQLDKPYYHSKPKGLSTAKVAARYKITGHDLEKKLEELKVLEYADHQYLLHPNFENCGYVNYTPLHTRHKNGCPKIMVVIHWLPEGVDFLDSLFM